MLTPSHTAHSDYMTHRDFAELTGVRPDNVKRTMETMQERGEITVTQFEGPITTGNGAISTTNLYRVNERDSYILMARLNPAFMAQLAEHWKNTKNAETKTQEQTPDFTNPLEAGQAWVEQYVAKQQLAQQLKITRQELNQMTEWLAEVQQQLEVAAPGLDFIKRYEASSGFASLTQFARKFSYKRKDLIEFMLDKKILRREGSRNRLMPYQCDIDAGRFVVLPWEKNGYCGEYMKITPKGELWIAKLWRNRETVKIQAASHLRLIQQDTI